jgi:hypothetical protein
MQFTGKIKMLLPVIEGTTNAGDPYAKREIVLESEPNEKGYTDEFKVEMFKTGEHVSFVLDGFKFDEGDKVSCEIGGRVSEYKGKYYGNLNIFMLTLVSKSTAVSETVAAPAQVAPQETAPAPTGSAAPLPF